MALDILVMRMQHATGIDVHHVFGRHLDDGDATRPHAMTLADVDVALDVPGRVHAMLGIMPVTAAGLGRRGSGHHAQNECGARDKQAQTLGYNVTQPHATLRFAHCSTPRGALAVAAKTQARTLGALGYPPVK